MNKYEPIPLAPCYATMPPGRDRMAVVACATAIEEMRPLPPAGMEHHANPKALQAAIEAVDMTPMINWPVGRSR